MRAIPKHWRPYSEKEKAFIINNIDRFSPKQIAVKLNRSERGIEMFVDREGIISFRQMPSTLDKFDMLKATHAFIETLARGSPLYDICLHQLKILSDIKK